ncbi:MAG: Rrf2 family transcriptional regulator [Treponema sp.]|nr:Rrf2 family transcriptional regulator [Treponema sp.]
MRITTRGRYALRASLALASLQNEAPVSINQLSREENISSVFLEQIFFRLRRAGIVSSVRGPGGGFQFTRDLSSITVKDVLQAAGEELNVTDCDKNAKACASVPRRCASHNVWADITVLLDKYLGSVTLASVLERFQKS